ncbi:MAG: hypothetical protein ACPLRZ_11400 [Thermovenabulum sp.]|uniref:hypothetical protein n=1 Tax=Thermovenabulum sp. TaxID=3100335 RepID=UPI003C7A8B07
MQIFFYKKKLFPKEIVFSSLLFSIIGAYFYANHFTASFHITAVLGGLVIAFLTTSQNIQENTCIYVDESGIKLYINKVCLNYDWKDIKEIYIDEMFTRIIMSSGKRFMVSNELVDYDLFNKKISYFAKMQGKTVKTTQP